MTERKGKYSKHLYFPLTRRNLIKGAAAGAVIAGAPAVLQGLTRRAKAQDNGTIRLLITGADDHPGRLEQRFESGDRLQDGRHRDQGRSRHLPHRDSR